MKRGLWRNHPATKSQQQLDFEAPGKRHRQPTQADVLIGMLRAARENGTSLELPAIMQAGIAQHGARFREIRDRGFEIENEMVRTADGGVRSRYWLRSDPERDGGQ